MNPIVNTLTIKLKIVEYIVIRGYLNADIRLLPPGRH